MKRAEKKWLKLLIILTIAISLFLLYKNRLKNADFKEKEETQVDENSLIEEEEYFNFSNITFENITSEEEGDLFKINTQYPKFNLEIIDKEIAKLIKEDTNYFKNQNAFIENPVSDNIYELKSEVYRNTNYLSVVFNIYEFTGGAHGNIRIKTLNFNKDGVLIEMGDLFSNSTNYLNVISEISREQLKDKFKDYDQKWIDEGTAPISKNFEDFYIKDESNLVFIFEPYTVGPWVIGTPTVLIDLNRSEIKNILKNI